MMHDGMGRMMGGMALLWLFALAILILGVTTLIKYLRSK
jgi:hypothetical protein